MNLPMLSTVKLETKKHPLPEDGGNQENGGQKGRRRTRTISAAEEKMNRKPEFEVVIPQGEFPPEHVHFKEDFVTNTVVVSKISQTAHELWGLSKHDEVIEVNGERATSLRRGARVFDMTAQSQAGPLVLGLAKTPKILGAGELAAAAGRFDVEFGKGDIGLTLRFDEIYQQVRVDAIALKSLASAKTTVVVGLFLHAVNGYLVENISFEGVVGMLRFEAMKRPLVLTFAKTATKKILGGVVLGAGAGKIKLGFQISKDKKFVIPGSSVENDTHTARSSLSGVGHSTSNATLHAQHAKSWRRFFPQNSNLQIRSVWQRKKIDHRLTSPQSKSLQGLGKTLQTSKSESHMHEGATEYDDLPYDPDLAYDVDCTHKGMTADKLETFLDRHIGMTMISLDLRGNPLFDRGAEMLHDGLGTGDILERLMVDSCKIGPQGFKHLSDLMRESTGLVYFSAEKNFAGGQGAEYLGAALTKMSKSGDSQLRTFSIRSNRITSSGCKAVLLGLVRNTTIVNVYLCSNDIDDRATLVISELFKRNHSIQRMLLTCNKFSDIGLSFLLDTNSFGNLLVLDLKNNPAYQNKDLMGQLRVKLNRRSHLERVEYFAKPIVRVNQEGWQRQRDRLDMTVHKDKTIHTLSKFSYIPD
jgi:hypothetical protein